MKWLAAFFAVAHGARHVDRQNSLAHQEPTQLKQHHVRICNAYPYNAGLDIWKNAAEQLTGSDPLSYRDCRDMYTNLSAGDRFEFKVGRANAGTFAVSQLPAEDSTLLLVIHRHDVASTAVAFVSHVFANLLNAQLVVIDTYKGAKKAKLYVTDGEVIDSRREGLSADSVVALNSGKYQALLEDETDGAKVQKPLVIANRESYVLLRVGVEAAEGPAFPEDIVVFPQTDPSTVHSGATMAGSMLAALTALFIM